MKVPTIPPKEKADQLLKSILRSMGLKTHHQISIEEYLDARDCANAAIDAIFDFMKEDDDLHECAHFANSVWVDYYQKVRKEL
jgi:hypothetical protein